ncbi:class I SAM-dependent methyltransferase [Alkalicoccus chagannorensis]|uniref:class I SAM-dependent methyltransferase n=1 Tax=Alkalicoccus chagannorensis TaxID=427072 RepID=UPI00047CF891|nr:class I SAM-dependent methyltransferase [Alkalicoccus chagannorensis]
MLGYYNRLSAEVYDLDKYIGRSFGDVEFYTQRLASCTGPILEPGVGNGRMLIPLLEQGHEVDGFDLSPDMLRLCRHHCSERGFQPHVWEGNMASIDLNQSYEAVIVPAGTFLLLHERRTSIAALQQFHHHLQPGGRLLVDTFLQPGHTRNEPVTSTWEAEDGSVITLEAKTTDIDAVHQYTISHHRYEKWKQGRLVQTELERFPLRWYGVEEFSLLLEQVGFTDITISADYQNGTYPVDAGSVITYEAVVRK